jgi:hypothetical protein
MAKKKGAVLDKQAEETGSRDAIRANVLKLVEQERFYHQCVKDYETECSKNEQLLARLGQ